MKNLSGETNDMVHILEGCHSHKRTSGQYMGYINHMRVILLLQF